MSRASGRGSPRAGLPDPAPDEAMARLPLWSAVPLLGVSQIVGYGSLFYAVALTAPRISDEFGWSRATGLGGFSLGLVVAGLASPAVGAAVGAHGGRRVMASGSLLAAVGLAALSGVGGLVSYYCVWAVLGVAMAMTLYDPAFATLGGIYGRRARSRITALTLIAGFASTLAWPATHWLIESHGWRGAYLAFSLATLAIAFPAHLLLPRRGSGLGESPDRDADTAQSGQVAELAPMIVDERYRRAAFVLVSLAIAANAFLFIGLSAHLLALFEDLGLSAAVAVAVGTLIGPSQVAARVVEFVFARRISPLGVGIVSAAMLPAAFLVLLVGGVTPLSAAVFAVIYGGANGLVTIVRGTLPLALFGAEGYALRLGLIARPALIVGAAAPFALGAAVDVGGSGMGLVLAFAAGCLSLAAMSGIAVVRARANRNAGAAVSFPGR
jgi:MFS family permease